MSNVAKDRERKGLASLEEAFFSEGRDGLLSALKSAGPGVMAEPYSILKAGSGQKTVRKDANEKDQIEYESYNPPSIWGAPYALHLVRFEPHIKNDFMYHVGEELLIPVAGEVLYHFFWSPGGKRPKRIRLPKPLKVGDIIRINPQIPHHTWAAGEVNSVAWMVFRDMSGSAAAISVGPVLDKENRPARRRVTESDLREAGTYGLIAWGLADKIRISRQKANLTIAELAQQIGVDASYIYRIENAETNVSTEKLLSIANVLNISLQDFVDSGTWYEEQGSIRANSSALQPALHTPKERTHFLHPYKMKLGREKSIDVKSLDEGYREEYSTWIFLQGDCLIKLRYDERSSDEILTKGSVLHFREQVALSMRALTDVQVLKIGCSRECGCVE